MDLPQPDYERGGIRLYNADFREVMSRMENGSVDMIWTDPPYGHNNADGDWLSRRDEIMGDGRGSAATAIANDSAETMRSEVDAMLVEAARVLSPDCCCCCCCCCCGGGPSPMFAWVASRMDGEGLQFFHSVIWDKRNPGVGWRYRRQHEMVMVAHRRGGRLLWADENRKQPNIISMSKPRTGHHPNEKPVELVSRFIQNHAPEGAMVCDPFMGSATTGVACVALGRRFIGIESDAEHFATACRRIDKAFEDQALFEPS